MTGPDQERRATKMVQYHIEGEHVFPEPECPSCRVDEALRRAAEIQKWTLCTDWLGRATSKEYAGGLAGWAEAIRAHAERPESEHDGGCSAGISKAPCKCSQRDRAEAVRRFCNAMLGGDDD